MIFQVCAVEIKVLDLVSGDAISTAKITNIHTGEAVYTNAKGIAEVPDIKSGDTVLVNQFGYERKFFSYKELADNKFTVRLKVTGITFDELIVSANKWEQERREIPVKITSVDPEEVRFNNPQTAADLLTLSGEVYIQKSQLGGGSPMIRGFATNRVLLTVDGVRMNNAIFRSGNLQNVISLDPLAIENTEVIFGPGSTIYGSDAIGGVMSFYTKSPEFAANGNTFVKGNVFARSSSANFEKTGHFDLNLGWSNFALLTSFSYSDFDDLKMGSNGPYDYLRLKYQTRINGRDTSIINNDPEVQTPTSYNQYNFMQKLKYKASESWDFDYGFHYSETSDYPRYDRLIRYKGDELRSAEWYYGPQIWMMNNLKINHSGHNSFYDHLSIGLAQQHFEESRHDRDFGGISLTNRTETVEAYSMNFDLEKKFTGGHKLFYGIETIFNIVGSEGSSENIETDLISPDATRYPDGSTWNSYSAYVSYRHKLSDKMNLQLGTRYNHYNISAEFDTTFYSFPFTTAENNSGALTGSAGLIYNPDETWQLIANASTGFRAPNIDDVGKVFDSEPGFVVVPNPDLKPEYAYNGELGVAKIIGNSLKLDISAYYTFLENALVRRDYSLNGQDSIMYDGELSRIQAIQNAANANVWGIQTGFEVKLPAGFVLTSRINYQQGEEELDDGTTAPLRHAPPLFGNTALNYSTTGFKISVYFDYNGEVAYDDLAPSEKDKEYLYAKDDAGNPYSPGWFTANIKTEYQVNQNIMLYAGVENFLDKRYRPYSSGLTAPGINFIFAAKLRI